MIQFICSMCFRCPDDEMGYRGSQCSSRICGQDYICVFQTKICPVFPPLLEVEWRVWTSPLSFGWLEWWENWDGRTEEEIWGVWSVPFQNQDQSMAFRYWNGKWQCSFLEPTSPMAIFRDTRIPCISSSLQGFGLVNITWRSSPVPPGASILIPAMHSLLLSLRLDAEGGLAVASRFSPTGEAGSVQHFPDYSRALLSLEDTPSSSQRWLWPVNLSPHHAMYLWYNPFNMCISNSPYWQHNLRMAFPRFTGHISTPPTCPTLLPVAILKESTPLNDKLFLSPKLHSLLGMASPPNKTSSYNQVT